MSHLMLSTLEQLIAALVSTPGQTVWTLCEQLGLKKQEDESHPRLADGTFTARKRHLGYDLVRRTLLAAAKRGEVESVKDVETGKRLWFIAADIEVLVAA